MQNLYPKNNSAIATYEVFDGDIKTGQVDVYKVDLRSASARKDKCTSLDLSIKNWQDVGTLQRARMTRDVCLIYTRSSESNIDLTSLLQLF